MTRVVRQRRSLPQIVKGEDLSTATEILFYIRRSAVKDSQSATPLLTRPSPDVVLSVGNWNISSTVEGELSIVNSDGQQQATILKEDLPGFLFQSNR